MKDLISLHDLTADEVKGLLELGIKLKAEQKSGKEHHILKGKTLGMIFTKSSTRTRVSFEVGMTQLGGYPLFLSSNDIQLGRGETIYDTAKVLERMLDGIMIRTYAHQDVIDLAEYADIPVINALTDLLHPCQVLADLMTAYEHKGKLEGLKLAYIGDGNNMAHSLMYGCAKAGLDCAIAAPDNYQCDAQVIANAKEDFKKSGRELILTNDPVEAIILCIQTHGCQWDRRKKRPSVRKCLCRIRLTAGCLLMLTARLYLCIVCPRIEAMRLLRRLLTDRTV